MDIKNNTFQRQFEAQSDKGLVSVEYSEQERKIFLTRINFPEGFDDENFTNEMLVFILEQASEKRQKVVPVFPKIAAFFRKNPKYKELLPPGIKL